MSTDSLQGLELRSNRPFDAEVGSQVTIEFVTADCGAGGHWGYAYIDSFCGDCSG